MGTMNEGEGYSTIPSNIQLNIFMQAAFDNGDYGQGNASQHVTNTVLYQYTQGSFQNVNRMLQNIGQSDISITVDQSIYQIVKQIQWVDQSLADIIIQLGGYNREKNEIIWVC